MPVRYARGPHGMLEVKPASAFSRGDILQLNSSSSVSRIAPTWESGADIFGVAGADSVDSINETVPVLLPEAETVFWISADTTLTSHLTQGMEVDVIFGTGNGRYYAVSSQNTPRAVIVEGTDRIDQSGESRVLAKFLYHAGNIDLS